MHWRMRERAMVIYGFFLLIRYKRCNMHCHIVGTMFFEGQFPISPRVVLNFFEKLCEITHFKKNPIVTTSVDNDKAKLIVPTSEDNEKSHCHH